MSLASAYSDPIVNQLLRNAIAHQQSGQFQQAEAFYRQVLARNPRHPDALHLLGLLAAQFNRFDVAAEFLAQAVAVVPGNFHFLDSLASVYSRIGKVDDAITLWNRAIAVKPDFIQGLCNLGVCLQNLKRFDEAMNLYNRILAIDPNFHIAIGNIAGALYEAGKFDESIAMCQKALALEPNDLNSCRVMAFNHQSKRQCHEAVHWYRRALELGPHDPDMHASLGSALQTIGEYDEAMRCYDQALRLDPRHANAHFNRALLLLLRGDYPAAWKEYEWRWECKKYQAEKPKFRQPMWDGTDLRGRTILLHVEQGFGDAIQFIRYVPMLVERGAKVIVGCAPQLKRLFGAIAGVSDCKTVGEALPAFDCYCPLLTLPLMFGTTLETVPTFGSYIKADPEISGQWKQKMESDSASLRVGLVWASGHAIHDKSVALSALVPLAQREGVRFYSLQKGPAAAEAAKPVGISVVDWTQQISDFADTAGIIDNLDLVITVDTAVAHLAGAMGKPVWTMLRFAPDWQWMLAREDTPWYPTMRLFRQRRVGDWAELIERVAEALRGFGRGN